MISGLGFENEQNRRVTVERCLACEADGRGNLDSREKAQKAQKRKTSSTADGRRFTQMGEGSLPRDPLRHLIRTGEGDDRNLRHTLKTSLLMACNLNQPGIPSAHIHV